MAYSVADKDTRIFIGEDAFNDAKKTGEYRTYIVLGYAAWDDKHETCEGRYR